MAEIAAINKIDEHENTSEYENFELGVHLEKSIMSTLSIVEEKQYSFSTVCNLCGADWNILKSKLEYDIPNNSYRILDVKICDCGIRHTFISVEQLPNFIGEQTKNEGKKTVCVKKIILAIILISVICIFGYKTSVNENSLNDVTYISNNITPSYEYKTGTYTDNEYIVVTKHVVENNLKAPKTAGFGKIAIDYSNGDAIATGYVDAQNSFGAEIRNYFIVTFYKYEVDDFSVMFID